MSHHILSIKDNSIINEASKFQGWRIQLRTIEQSIESRLLIGWSNQSNQRTKQKRSEIDFHKLGTV
jgi:hypothetical protein